MLEADQTSGTASRLSLQVSRSRALLVALLPYGEQEVRPVDSGALRIRARITRPGSTSRTRGSPSGRPHPVPLAMYLLLPAFVQWLHLGRGCRPTAQKVLGVHGWSLTRDHHAGNGADIAVSSPADLLEACRTKGGRLGIKSLSNRMAPIDKGRIRNSRRTSTSKKL